MNRAPCENDECVEPTAARYRRCADLVRVGSGKRVLVFNVCGNDYRLIVAMHFDRQMAYTLRFLTHAEYSRERWKDDL